MRPHARAPGPLPPEPPGRPAPAAACRAPSWLRPSRRTGSRPALRDAVRAPLTAPCLAPLAPRWRPHAAAACSGRSAPEPRCSALAWAGLRVKPPWAEPQPPPVVSLHLWPLAPTRRSRAACSRSPRLLSRAEPRAAAALRSPLRVAAPPPKPPLAQSRTARCHAFAQAPPRLTPASRAFACSALLGVHACTRRLGSRTHFTRAPLAPPGPRRLGLLLVHLPPLGSPRPARPARLPRMRPHARAPGPLPPEPPGRPAPAAACRAPSWLRPSRHTGSRPALRDAVRAPLTAPRLAPLAPRWRPHAAAARSGRSAPEPRCSALAWAGLRVQPPWAEPQPPPGALRRLLLRAWGPPGLLLWCLC
ncbi:formin-like protein 5 [Panicum hallii]|uniref:formin-like protein 5 n=1 Tax=Panicum hallii TaxID=206008 RepID=UPI000DF4E51E|nr:formin-like protein 5 [Panicum hallii]